MSSYHDASVRVKPKRTSAPKKSRNFQQADFKAAAMSERRGLSDGAKLFLVTLADIVDGKGRSRLTDEALADRIGCEASSVPGLFARAEELRYLVPVSRKRGGERDYQVHSRWIGSAADESEETHQAKETENPIADSAGERNPEKKKRNYQETPEENISSRTRVRDSSKDSLQESLDSDFPGEEAGHADELGEQESLERLRHYYHAEHYCYPVQRAAEILSDLPGLPHYRNMLHLTCGNDETLFAQGLLAMRGRKPSVSDRAYLRQTLKGLVRQHAKAQADAEYIAAQDAKHSRVREAAQAAEPIKATDQEAAMDQDPFAEPDASVFHDDNPADAPDEPVPQGDDAPKQVAPDEAMPPREAVYHEAVQEAADALRIGHDIDKLQSAFHGGCRGRVEVFNLGVQTILRSQKPVKSPVSLILQLALEHAAKDATWLSNRANGLTTADCTRLLVAWEQHLEREKLEKNGGAQTWRYPAGDITSIIRSIIDQSEATMDGDEPSLAEFNSLTLPTTPQEWSELEEEYTRLASVWDRLDDNTRAVYEERAAAFADAKSPLRMGLKWKNWQRRALYHQAAGLANAMIRQANVKAAQEAADDTGIGLDAIDECE